MKRTKISRAIEYLDDSLVADALETRKIINPYKNKKVISGVMAVAASLLLIFGGVIFINQNKSGTNQNPAVQGGAVVAIDVNPGLELELTAEGRVKEVKTFNDDAKIVVGDMNLKDVELKVAVNAIIGSMLGHGYLTVEKNSILVSVDAQTESESLRLQNEIKSDISALFANSGIDITVITQNFEKGKAETAGISPARAALIRKIIASGLAHADGNPYTYEQLLPLNITELKQILDSKKLTVEGMTSTGNAGENGLFGMESAKSAAIEEAGLDIEFIFDIEVELDYDDELGRLIYEVEFESETHEYEYELDGRTGEILKKETEEKH